MGSWTQFCSSYPNSTNLDGDFVIYLPDLQDFTECFHDLYHITAAGILLLGSVYFVLILSRSSYRTRIRSHERFSDIPFNAMGLRIVASCLIIVVIITQQVVLLSRSTLRTSLGLAEYLRAGVSLLAWTALLYHSVLFIRKRFARRINHRGCSLAQEQLIMTLLWFPVMAGSIFEVWSAIGGVYRNLPIIYSVYIYIFFGCQVLILISFLWILSMPETVINTDGESESLISVNDEDERPSIASAYEDAGLFSKTLVSWAGGLIRNGPYLKTADDLFRLPVELEFAQIGQIFRDRLAADLKTSKIYLIRVLWSMWGRWWLFIGFLDLLAVMGQYALPLFLQKLVEFFEGDRSDPGKGTGYGWAAGMLGVSLLSALLNTHYRLLIGKLSISVTGVLVDSVYRKLFSVYGADVSSPGMSGKVVNLIGSDCERINDGLLNLHNVWVLPLEVGIALYLLYLQVGVAFLGGIGVTLVLAAANQLTVARLVSYGEKKQAASDVRVKNIQEILNCIRVIKLHAWEEYFQKRVTTSRRIELQYLRVSAIFSAIVAAIWQTVPLGMAVTTFLIYVLTGHTLTAAKVFTSIALFRMLADPLMLVAWAVLGTVEMWVSVKRLQTFFKLPDLILSQLYDVINDRESDDIQFRDAEFSAGTSEEIVDATLSSEAIIHNVTLGIRPGEFVGVTGVIGSGKTVLLNSLIGELHKTSGDLAVKEHILSEGFGYAPQEPWILQGTIRQNILFGQNEIDLARYQQVLECCALSDDLENMPNGDATEIGERGVTLSGGQKARLSLARAVYQNKAVILLDDPLAAVDAHVAATIYTKCIIGLLASKTRILVTHNVEGLRECDRVIVMKDGAVHAIGSPDEVLTLATIEADSRPNLDRVDSRHGTSRHKRGMDRETETEVAPVINEEKSESGVVKWSVYVTIFRAIGWPTVIIGMIFCCLSQGTINACDVWISYWVGVAKANMSSNSTAEDDRYFLTIYGTIAGAGVFTSIMWPVLLFLGFLKASRILHSLLTAAILRAKMMFFDSTPSGRILNRFSKDINAVDEQLPLEALIFWAEVCGVVGTLSVIVYSMPWFLAVIIPVGVVYYIIQSHYRYTARELKRLNATSLSPLYSLYGETIHGLTTIRSMRANERFCERFSNLLRTQQQVQFAMLAAEQWLEMRLELLAVLLIAGVLLVGFVTLSQSESVGLALSYSLSVVGGLISLISVFIRFEKGMVNVERIKQYIDDVEPEAFDGPVTTMPNWPNEGKIEINDLSFRYTADQPKVLDSIQLSIRAGEKIGIIGRTGAGKSTLMLAIFRIIEPSAGSIIIDNVEISQLKLRHLRSRLTMVPQTASLFDASIRDNLDPLQQYQDHEVWNAIDKCHLRPVVEKLGGTLTSQVGDNGKNLSAGEKQLVSLGRAILSTSKIICLDEATANIDFETDLLVQQTIRECLSGSTILTIAHRVQTVMDCDRVIVMSTGRISEAGSPNDLMNQPDSRFYQLVQRSKQLGEIQ